MTARAQALIRDVPNFPIDGIIFKDLTPVLGDAAALRELMDLMCEAASIHSPDLLAGIESRGFIFGAGMAHSMGLGFVPVRKLGKLPAETVREEYALEYGTNTLEMHRDAVLPGQRVVIVDDLLATGGTALAAARLVEKVGGLVAGFVFAVELDFLQGRDRLGGRDVHSLIHY